MLERKVWAALWLNLITSYESFTLTVILFEIFEIFPVTYKVTAVITPIFMVILIDESPILVHIIPVIYIGVLQHNYDNNIRIILISQPTIYIIWKHFGHSYLIMKYSRVKLVEDKLISCQLITIWVLKEFIHVHLLIDFLCHVQECINYYMTH